MAPVDNRHDVRRQAAAPDVGVTNDHEIGVGCGHGAQPGLSASTGTGASADDDAAILGPWLKEPLWDFMAAHLRILARVAETLGIAAGSSGNASPRVTEQHYLERTRVRAPSM